MVSASPGLWDLGEAAKANRLQGVDPLRGFYSGNDFVGAANQSRQLGFSGQQDALGMLQRQAAGQGPSIAGTQMQQGLGNAQRAAMAMAARGRGGNLAGMQQAALNAGAGLQAGVIRDQGLARVAEQLGAQQQYAGLASQLYGQGFGYDQLASQQALQADRNSLDWYAAQRGMDLQRDQMNRDWTLGLIQAGAGTVGGLMGAGAQLSDERSKQNMQPTLGSVSAAVGEATPVAFNYKPGMGDGNPNTHFGFTAQDLERTPLGPSLVVNRPDGKYVDTGNAAMASLAGVAELRRELDALKSGEFRAVPPTQPRPSTMYDPGQDVSFGERMTAARAARPGFIDGPTSQGFAREQLPPPDPYRDMSFDVAARARTIDPFVLSDERSKTNMRSTLRPVADGLTPDMANQVRRVEVAPYRPGSARATPIPTDARQPRALTPQEQALVDAAQDIVDRSTMLDEAGRRVVRTDAQGRATFMPEASQFFFPRGERRFLAEEEAASTPTLRPVTGPRPPRYI